MSLIVRMRQKWDNVAPKLTYVGLWASLALLMVIFPFIQGPSASWHLPFFSPCSYWQPS